MTEECKSCAILRRYEKTARERGYAMGKAAGNNELAQAQELLAFERKAHAETNAALTAEITRLEAQLAAKVPDDEQAKFEAHFQLNSREQMKRRDGNYFYPEVRAKWDGWKAALGFDIKEITGGILGC